MRGHFIKLTDFSTDQPVLVGLRQIQIIRVGYKNGPGCIIQYDEDDEGCYRIDVVEAFHDVLERIARVEGLIL